MKKVKQFSDHELRGLKDSCIGNSGYAIEERRRFLATIDELKAENAHYRTALEFYSDSDNWSVITISEGIHKGAQGMIVALDRGKKASEALKGGGEE